MSDTSKQAVLAAQKEYIERVGTILASRYTHQPKALVQTYGCQQNVSDSERMKGFLAEMGYAFTEDVEQADLILCNTCAVRGHAEDRVYGNVGAFKHQKRRRPDCIIALCGCMMQQPQVADRIKRSYPHVDLVFGTHVQHRLPELLYRCLTGGRVFELDDSHTEIVEGLPVRRDSAFRGWLPIMYGCNNFCTYCIVPYVRGRERSRAPEDVVAEAESMVAAGYKDITLLGQNVNSYGKGEAHGVDFARLLRMVNAIPGDFRIRFMTSHPKDCTLELLDAMADCEKVCGHLHLPFQSGSDRVLKAMNRHYDRAGYLRLVEEARRRMPDIALTSDVIVGFPGETYREFQDTLSLVEQVGFSSLFTFIYSPREGTPAAGMEDPVPHGEKVRWFNELLAAQEKIGRQKAEAVRDETLRLLCEEDRGAGILAGRAENNRVVEFPGDPALVGRFVQVRITQPGVSMHRGVLAE